MRKRIFLFAFMLFFFNSLQFSKTRQGEGALFFKIKEVQARYNEKLKPKLTFYIDYGKPEYLYYREHFQCSEEVHNTAAGCARKRTSFSLKPIYSSKTGKLTEFEVHLILKPEIEISTLYKRGTCRFNLILKHELTHVAISRRVMARFAPEIAKALLARFQSYSGPFTQAHYDNLNSLFYEYEKQMHEEIKKIDGLMDTQEGYSYQSRQCSDNPPDEIRKLFPKIQENNRKTAFKNDFVAKDRAPQKKIISHISERPPSYSRKPPVLEKKPKETEKKAKYKTFRDFEAEVTGRYLTPEAEEILETRPENAPAAIMQGVAAGVANASQIGRTIAVTMYHLKQLDKEQAEKNKHKYKKTKTILEQRLDEVDSKMDESPLYNLFEVILDFISSFLTRGKESSI